MEFQNEKYIIQNKKFTQETHISGACLQTSREDRGEKKHPLTENMLKKWTEPQDLWDNIKMSNIHVIGTTEERRKLSVQKKNFEDIITTNFTNSGKDTNYKCKKLREHQTG